MTNEAAEELRDYVDGCAGEYNHKYDPQPLVDAALAAERKATVERIRAKINWPVPFGAERALTESDLYAILDAEAAR